MSIGNGFAKTQHLKAGTFNDSSGTYQFTTVRLCNSILLLLLHALSYTQMEGFVIEIFLFFCFLLIMQFEIIHVIVMLLIVVLDDADLVGEIVKRVLQRLNQSPQGDLQGLNLVNLRKVDLDGSSSLMELPDLSKASNLREVSISGCKSLCQVPPSAVCSQKLKYLNVSNCESLESIAELPASVVCVIARDCRSLHTVSVSALDSVAEEAIQQQQFEDITFNFSNCYKLEENAKNSIMEHAYGRLKRPLAAAPTCATTAWLDKEDKHPYRYLSGKQHNHPKLNVLSGADPGWFRYINPQNGAVTLDVAPGDSLLGFIFWVVFPAYSGSYQVSATSVSYTYCVEVRNGPSFSYDGHWMPDEDIWLNDYYFWYDGQCCIDMIKVMEENTNTNNNNIQLKVSFKFFYNRLILSQPIEEDDDKEVEYWGVHPIYASDVRGGMSMESVNDVNLNMNVPSIEEGNGGSIDDSDEDDEGSERGGVSELIALMHGGKRLHRCSPWAIKINLVRKGKKLVSDLGKILGKN
ncbi:hypothetical protein Ahy_A08g039004 isoform E [Arachis hypogaea]|uniref:Uncharacterized protein n=1 Tax=Arachis hypogaea TaxID=3818 RepID=A0A445BVD9_ARAHY|nr:hypothetical protein Ahy_A08g039004 isoform E [Arachis hypogaea]